ncbi:hypothetical protein D5086_003069 [Populus alba]|uniref:Uncharacterized protein n=1 Tax=Populus alba TaxID=43335 RepID=A0ACC4D427_POPAL
MAFKAVCLMVVAFVLVTAQASYMNGDFKEKLGHTVMDQQLVNGPSRTRPDENETISLDPVVGIRSATENQSSYQLRALHAELTNPNTKQGVLPF